MQALRLMHRNIEAPADAGDQPNSVGGRLTMSVGGQDFHERQGFSSRTDQFSGMVQKAAWFRKRCFWVTQASGIIPLFKAELVSNAILLEVVDESVLFGGVARAGRHSGAF